MEKTRRFIAHVTYTPESGDSFTRVQAHYTAEIEGLGTGKGRDVYSALREVPGYSNWDDISRVVPVDWPCELHEKWYDEQYNEALRDEDARKKDAAARAKHDALRALISKRMQTWNLRGEEVYLSIDSDYKIEVPDVGRYNKWRHKHETVYRRRFFKPGKDGSYNWAKIQEATQQVAGFKANETKSRLEDSRAEATSASIMKELGPEEGKGWNASSGGKVSLTITASSAEEARAIKTALCTIMALQT
jgi:hypothetical protein